MPLNDYTVNLGFSVSADGLEKGFAQAKAQAKAFQTQMKSQMSGVSTQMTSALSAGKQSLTGFAASFSIVTTAATSAVQTIVQVAQAVTDMAKQFDTAEKTARYFDSTFGSLSDNARAWAEQLSDSYGLYSTDVESYMATLMDAFHRSGNGLSEAYNMAKDFTQLSWDLSEFFPQYSVEEIQDMLKDLAVGGGEEALEKLLPGWDEETLKAKAYAEGIAEAGEELTVLQKNQAAYLAMMDEYSGLQGMYGAADSATKSINGVGSALDELKEELGGVFSPVVEAVAEGILGLIDKIREKIDELKENWNNMVGAARGFVNWISRGLGFGDVWTVEDDAQKAVDNMTASTGALEEALSGLEKQTAETVNAMQGLAGFDRLYTVKNTDANKTDEIIPSDWESAFDEWLAMFITMPDEAIDKMDPLWDKLLTSNAKTVDEFKEQYGDYFDWVTESELATADLTDEQKRDIMDTYYADITDAHNRYQDEILKENEKYAQQRADAEKGLSDKTLEEIEAEHLSTTQSITDAYQTEMSEAFSTVLVAFGIASESEADAMKTAFEKKVEEIESAYGAVFEGLHKELDDLNAAIAEAQARLSNTQKEEKSLADKIGDAWGKVTDFGGDILEVLGGSSWDEARGNDTNWKPKGYAAGGLFEPNDPQLVVMGDNTVEPEVAAPRSMIEEAMQNVINRNGGLSASSGSQTLEITIPLTLDGKTLARAQYKYLIQESKRRGNRAGFA